MTAPVYARGVAKTLCMVPETTYGTSPAGPSGGGLAQLLRRTTSNMDPQIQQIDSSEILVSQMQRDSRLGPRKVMGMINGYLSPGTYEQLFLNLFRATSAGGGYKSGITDASLAIPGTFATPMTLTSPANAQWLNAGFRVGDLVKLTGCTAPYTNNNQILCQVVGVTQTVLSMVQNTNGMTAFTAGSPAMTITVGTPGKKLFMNANPSNQTLGSFTFEHWYADAGISEVTSGARVTSITLNIPSSGFVTFQAQYMGLNLLHSNTQIYTSAMPQTGAILLTASNGSLLYNGVAVAVITGLNVTISASNDLPAVVGTNVSPNLFVGTVTMRGSLTALMINDTLTNDFLSENELQIQVLMTTTTTTTFDFVQLMISRAKLTAETKNDSDREITRSFNFVGLEQSVLGGTGLQYDDTMMVINDSLAV